MKNVIKVKILRKNQLNNHNRLNLDVNNDKNNTINTTEGSKNTTNVLSSIKWNSVLTPQLSTVYINNQDDSNNKTIKTYNYSNNNFN